MIMKEITIKEFIEKLDKHNLCLKTCKYFNSYLYGYPTKIGDEEHTLIRITKYDNDTQTAVFRVPGATRGGVRMTMDFIIKEVVFCEDQCFKSKSPNGVYCYDESVIEEMEEVKGCKLIIPNYELFEKVKSDDLMHDTRLIKRVINS